LTHLKNSHSEKQILSQALSEAQKLSILLKNKTNFNNSSLTRLSLDKGSANLQLMSLRHPKTMDEKSMEKHDKQSPSNLLWNPKSSFLKRSHKMNNIRSIVEKEEQETQPERKSCKGVRQEMTKEIKFKKMKSVENDFCGEEDLKINISFDKNSSKEDDPYLYRRNDEELLTPRIQPILSNQNLENSNQCNKMKTVGNSYIDSSSLIGFNSNKFSSKKKNSNLQKKLKKLQKIKQKMNPFKTWTRSCNNKKLTKYKPKTQKIGCLILNQKAKLNDIIIKSFKKHTLDLTQDFQDKSEFWDNEMMLTPQHEITNRVSLSKLSSKHEKTTNKSFDLRDKYLSSCNLVSTNRLEFFDELSISRLNDPKADKVIFNQQIQKTYNHDQNIQNSVCFQSHQANEMSKRKNEYLKNKKNIEKKIEKIDKKLKQIDNKLLFMKKTKKAKAFHSNLFIKKKNESKKSKIRDQSKYSNKAVNRKFNPYQSCKKNKFKIQKHKNLKKKTKSISTSVWNLSPSKKDPFYSQKPLKINNKSISQGIKFSRLKSSKPSSTKSTLRHKNTNFRKSIQIQSNNNNQISYDINSHASKKFINL
jgi:hypothetical protein